MQTNPKFKLSRIIEEDFDKEIKVKKLYNNLGIAYYAIKDNVKVKKIFEYVIKIDPSYNYAIDNFKNIYILKYSYLYYQYS